MEKREYLFMQSDSEWFSAGDVVVVEPKDEFRDDEVCFYCFGDVWDYGLFFEMKNSVQYLFGVCGVG